MLSINQNQDIIQINNTTNSFVLTKIQYQFSKRSEMLGAMANTMAKPSNDNVYLDNQNEKKR